MNLANQQPLSGYYMWCYYRQSLESKYYNHNLDTDFNNLYTINENHEQYL